MEPDNLQLFVMGLLQIDKERRRPIWVAANGVLITGIVISQHDKNLIDLESVKNWLEDMGNPMSEMIERDLEETSSEESQFQETDIHFENAAIYTGGITFTSTVTVKYSHIVAWGLGNPPIKSIALS
jgi:hypothetical protein